MFTNIPYIKSMDKTEKYIIYATLVISFTFSIVSLCSSLPRTSGLDYIGVIVGILSLLVTILIGWQITNYFMLEKRTKAYAERLIKQYSYSVDCYAIALTAVIPYQQNNTEMGIDTSIQALKSGLQGYDKSTMSLPMAQLINLAKDCKAKKYKVKIYKGRMQEYINILSNVKDADVKIILDMIINADEV